MVTGTRGTTADLSFQVLKGDYTPVEVPDSLSAFDDREIEIGPRGEFEFRLGPGKSGPARMSGEAIGRAQARFGSLARFLVADMTRRLPFPDGSFDAVMSNVAAHMFPDGVTRAVFAQVGRLVRAGGLFVFHVNSLEDRPLRARRLPARELEPDYVAEESGQTVHFFSEACLRELLAGWQQVQLVPVPVPHRKTGEPFKHVWRGIARRRTSADGPPNIFCRPGLVHNLSDHEKRTRRPAT